MTVAHATRHPPRCVHGPIPAGEIILRTSPPVGLMIKFCCQGFTEQRRHARFPGMGTKRHKPGCLKRQKARARPAPKAGRLSPSCWPACSFWGSKPRRPMRLFPASASRGCQNPWLSFACRRIASISGSKSTRCIRPSSRQTEPVRCAYITDVFLRHWLTRLWRLAHSKSCSRLRRVTGSAPV